MALRGSKQLSRVIKELSEALRHTVFKRALKVSKGIRRGSQQGLSLAIKGLVGALRGF